MPSRAETRITGRFQFAMGKLLPASPSPDPALELARRRAGGRAEIGLVHDEDVGRLEHAGLHELEPVARAGVRDIDERVDERGRLDLGLAHAHRLDEDAVEGRAEDHDRRAGRLREAAQAVARRHRAQEDAGIGGGRAHADAIAEQGAAAGRARRVDGHDRERLPARPQLTHERVEQARLSGAGRPGDPDARRAGEGRLALERIEQPQRQGSLVGAAVLDEVQRFDDGVAIAREHALREFRRQDATPPRRRRSRP